MKQLVIFALVGLTLLFSPLIIESIRAYRHVRTCLPIADSYVESVNKRVAVSPETWNTWIENIQQCTRSFTSWDTLFERYLTIIPGIQLVVQRAAPTLLPIEKAIRAYVPLLKTWLPHMAEISGIYGKRTYLVLLQNNTELRPTGGFLGSFIVVTTEGGRVAEMRAEDIYAPDGQLKGYVEAPEPVKTYLFQQGGWKLRDSNWNPNFPEAAQTMLWFFEKGGYKYVDGVVAVTLSAIQDALKPIGDVYIPDYDKHVDTETLYSFMQSQTELSFFPGATSKRDVLGAVMRSVTRAINDLPFSKKKEVADAVMRRLDARDIQIWMKNPDVQSVLESRGWDGSLRQTSCESDRCRSDALAIVEANVGINKTNCCVDRTAQYDLWFNPDGTATSSVSLYYQNHNPVTPQPPKFYGGGYRNYLRIYRRLDATLIQSEINGSTVTRRDITTEPFPTLGLVSYGMLVDVPGGGQTTTTAQFEHALKMGYTEAQRFLLFIWKQSGLTTNDYHLTIHVPSNTIIRSDRFQDLVKKTDSHTYDISVTVDKDILFAFTLLPS